MESSLEESQKETDKASAELDDIMKQMKDLEDQMNEWRGGSNCVKLSLSVLSNCYSYYAQIVKMADISGYLASKLDPPELRLAELQMKESVLKQLESVEDQVEEEQDAKSIASEHLATPRPSKLPVPRPTVD